MKEHKERPGHEIHPCVAKRLRAKTQDENTSDAPFLDEKKWLPKRPKDFPERVLGNRREVKQILTQYRAGLTADWSRIMGRSDVELLHPPSYPLSFDDHYKNVVDDEVSKKPLRQLAPYLKRFDWRDYGIVPRPRRQEGNTCWAYAATAAFESSLMFQMGRFTVTHGDDNTDPYQLITLNVNRTLAEVTGSSEDGQNRHERAFNYFVKRGIPLNEVAFDDFKKRDAALITEPHKRSRRVKAIAWDWVLSKFWKTPIDEYAIGKIKGELLNHGPLVVSVYNFGEFPKYGTPGEDAASSNATTASRQGINLRFRPNMVTFKKNKKTGKLFLTFLNGVVPGWDDNADNLQVRFPADNAPRLELRTNTQIKTRPTKCDDAVTTIPIDNQVSPNGIAFTANNAVEIDTDAAANEVIVQFPDNTGAQITRESATGDLIVSFPADQATIFTSDQDATINHFVLLIGWDDDKCAWIVQNTFPNWGYQCKSPQDVFSQMSGKLCAAYEERAYMYIGYGCNSIGQNAAWIEAPLLFRAPEDKNSSDHKEHFQLHRTYQPIRNGAGHYS